MDGLRESLVAFISAAVICSVIMRLLQGIRHAEPVRILCGLFMTIVLLHPISAIRDTHRYLLFPQWEYQAQDAADSGIQKAKEMTQQIIIQQTQAYIIDRAAAMGAVVEAAVSLEDDGMPVQVEVYGTISPAVRSRLSEVLSKELGIKRENQQWIG